MNNFFCHISWLIAIPISGCSVAPGVAARDITYDRNIPPGTWAAGQGYELRKQGYVVNDRYSMRLLDTQKYSGLAEYVSNPSSSNGYFVGVAEIGDHFHVDRLLRSDTSATGTVRVNAIFETGRMVGKTIEVHDFGGDKMMFGDYGLIYPPDPKWLRRVR